MDIEEYNRRAHLANFPPEERWERVEGALYQPRSRPDAPPLVSINGRDHTGAEVRFWTDLPNAMHLLHHLAQIQRSTHAQVPSNPPPACEPFDGNA